MIFVVDQTVGTKSNPHTIQTEHIAFTFIGISMNRAGVEVTCSQHWFKPWRTQIIVPHSAYRTHLRIQYKNQSGKQSQTKSGKRNRGFFQCEQA